MVVDLWRHTFRLAPRLSCVENGGVKKPVADTPSDPKLTTGTLVWKHPDRLVAMCREGIVYTWFSKRSGFAEGDLVHISYDVESGDVFYFAPVGSLETNSGASNEGA